MPRLLQRLGPRELNHADGGSDVGEVVFEAWCHDVVGPGSADLAESVERILVEPVRAHQARTCSDFGIARHDHAAFAGGDGFAGVEAEHAGIRLPRAYQATVTACGHGMRSILDDLEAVTVSECQYLGHVTGEAAEVDRHDRLAARRQTALGVVEIDAASASFDVDQDDFRSEIADDRGSRREGERRHNHLVARTDSARLGCEM